MEQIRKILIIPCLLLLAASVVSCSDDFLSKNNYNLYMLPDTLFLSNNQDNVETTVNLPVPANSDYSVFMQPKWLSFNSMHGKVSSGEIPLAFSIRKDYFPTGYQVYYASVILEVENYGLVSFVAAYADFGSPTLQCSVAALDFLTAGSRTFTISNTSEGILQWKITGVPDWLIVSSISGSLDKNNSTVITVSLDFSHIQEGQELTGSINITSNSVTGALSLPVHVAASSTIMPEVIKIAGIVTDAEYNHETKIITISTKTPNSLIILNTGTKESVTIPLDKTPNCISQSEDGHKAVIGYSVSLVSSVDIDNRQIIRDYSIDCIPYDIVLDNSGWCYITPSSEQWANMRNLNLNTGELTQTAGTGWSMIYEKTLIRKKPGKPILAGTRTTLSPTGILIFDISNGMVNETISYYHTSTGNLWISADGARLYDGFRNVWLFPEYDAQFHPSSPQLYGQIESELENISAFDECPALNSIFVSSSHFDYSQEYTTVYSPVIEQFNTSSLNRIRTFTVSPVFVTENGIRTLYETRPAFVFTNKEGSNLYVLKNLKEIYGKDYWTIETFPI